MCLATVKKFSASSALGFVNNHTLTSKAGLMKETPSIMSSWVELMQILIDLFAA